MQNIVHTKNEIKDFFLNFIFFFSEIGLFGCSTGANLNNIIADKIHKIGDNILIVVIQKGAVKKVPKKKGCDLAKKQDSSLFLWYN